MLVHELIHRPPVTLGVEVTVREAAQLMRAQKVGCVLAMDNGAAVGIVTESDLVRLVAEDCDLSSTPLRDVMSNPVVTVEAATTLEDAAQLMRERNVKRLAVVVGTELRGVVTVRDLAYAMPEEGRRFLEAMKARWQD